MRGRLRLSPLCYWLEMGPRKGSWRIAGGVVLLVSLFAFQRPFRVYPSMEPYDDIPLPTDWQQKTEWVFARLMYPQHPNARFGRWRRYGAPLLWTEGATSWTQDYPRADRHFAQALRRLTRLDVRSVEQPVNLDDAEDVFNWPWLCAGEMGDWKLTDSQAKTLREYLLRGGFLMLDDFWGPRSGTGLPKAWSVFFLIGRWWKSKMRTRSSILFMISTIVIKLPGSGP